MVGGCFWGSCWITIWASTGELWSCNTVFGCACVLSQLLQLSRATISCTGEEGRGDCGCRSRGVVCAWYRHSAFCVVAVAAAAAAAGSRVLRVYTPLSA
jgi:hypothetical protein